MAVNTAQAVVPKGDKDSKDAKGMRQKKDGGRRNRGE